MQQDDLSDDPEDSEHPPEERARAGARSTWFSVAVNVGLATTQVIVGIVARSQGLIADGVHSLSDLVADIVVLFAGHHSRKGADADHPYGHQRFETAASLALGVLLLVSIQWYALARRLVGRPATWKGRSYQSAKA